RAKKISSKGTASRIAVTATSPGLGSMAAASRTIRPRVMAKRTPKTPRVTHAATFWLEGFIVHSSDCCPEPSEVRYGSPGADRAAHCADRSLLSSIAPSTRPLCPRPVDPYTGGKVVSCQPRFMVTYAHHRARYGRTTSTNCDWTRNHHHEHPDYPRLHPDSRETRPGGRYPGGEGHRLLAHLRARDVGRVRPRAALHLRSRRHLAERLYPHPFGPAHRHPRPLRCRECAPPGRLRRGHHLRRRYQRVAARRAGRPQPAADRAQLLHRQFARRRADARPLPAAARVPARHTLPRALRLRRPGHHRFAQP